MGSLLSDSNYHVHLHSSSFHALWSTGLSFATPSIVTGYALSYISRSEFNYVQGF